MQRRQIIQWGAASLAAPTITARAQSFPVKPIKLVIAFPAGGPTDITMRVLADNASKILGQPVVVENKPGAGGTLPAQAVDDGGGSVALHRNAHPGADALRLGVRPQPHGVAGDHPALFQLAQPRLRRATGNAQPLGQHGHRGAGIGAQDAEDFAVGVVKKGHGRSRFTSMGSASWHESPPAGICIKNHCSAY